jgi:Na+-translocating ferredoxin:NAD+ oxidoreductase RnfC subunit
MAEFFDITEHTPISPLSAPLEAMEKEEVMDEVESMEEAMDKGEVMDEAICEVESPSVSVVKLTKAESVRHRLERRATSARARSAQTKKRLEVLEDSRKKYFALKKEHKALGQEWLALEAENARLTLEIAKATATRGDAQLVIEAKDDDEPLLV